MYNLRLFFEYGRKPNGSFFGENECVHNATERNLSVCTDAEIIALREAARAFIGYCDAELTARDHDDP